MKAVKAAHKSLVDGVATREIFDFEPIEQDRSRQLRYSRNVDFDDAVASAFLARRFDNADLRVALDAAPQPDLVRPFRY